MTPIQIRSHEYNKIMEYAHQCAWEISGFGHFTYRDGTIVVDEVFPLLPQECTGTETEITKSALSGLIESPYSKRVNLWWHSHVNMGVFWSKTDDECVESLGQTLPHLLSIVVNKKEDYRARVDSFRPYRMMVDKIDMEILTPSLSPKEVSAIAKEVKKNVKFKVFEPVIHTPNLYGYQPYSPPKDKEPTGFFDKKIPLSLESDLEKLGYIYDDTINQWVFPVDGRTADTKLIGGDVV